MGPAVRVRLLLRGTATLFAGDGAVRAAAVTAGILGVVLLAVLALAALRTLGLPAYWVFFVPILDGILVGSLDIATLAVLVIAGGRLSALAPFLKIYGAIPMIGERRWRALALSGLALAITAPVLPWGMFLASLPDVASHLASQSMTTSVWGSIPLMLVFGLGLLSLGLRRAGWLAVPILWPSTQPHYAAISLPVVATSMILAIGYAFSFLMPWAPAAATSVFILVTQYRWFAGSRGRLRPRLPRRGARQT